MNIEILDFYPIEQNKIKGFLSGTIRIKLLDLSIHILGIYISKRKDFWYFRLPGGQLRIRIIKHVKDFAASVKV